MHWSEWSLNLWLIVLVSTRNGMNTKVIWSSEMPASKTPETILSILLDQIWSIRVAVFYVTPVATVMCGRRRRWTSLQWMLAHCYRVILNLYLYHHQWRLYLQSEYSLIYHLYLRWTEWDYYGMEDGIQQWY